MANKTPIGGNVNVSMGNDFDGSTSASQESSRKLVEGEQDDLADGGQLPSTHEDDNRAAEMSKSEYEVGDLSGATNAFKSRFDELQEHLDFTDKAIAARFRELAMPPNTTQNTQPALEKESVLGANQKLKMKNENGGGDEDHDGGVSKDCEIDGGH